MISNSKLSIDLKLVREKSPLVHNITNYVVMNNTANALLAVGASPVMAHAVEEVADMASIASALVINMGTLDSQWVEGMLLAGKTAKSKGVPVIFDPVGEGATPYRNKTAAQIISVCKPDIIRGNSSEIMSLANENCGVTKGVDSTTSSDVAVESAKLLATKFNAVVSISGEVDYITDGKVVRMVKNGHYMMPKVTGMGCTASAIVGAFAAIDHDFLEATTNAMALMGVAGEMAAEKSEGPGSLQLHFLDILYNITPEQLEKFAKIN